MARTIRVGLIGARGYVGAELITLLDRHPRFELGLVASRALAGQAVPGVGGDRTYEVVAPEDVGAHPEIGVWILALPNGLAAPWVTQIDEHRPDAVVLDLSSDFRFCDTWVYGLPETHRASIHRARRIANPGCYATAAQLALRPILGQLSAPPHVFGVSGYSGAGTTPSAKNDPENLKDNLIPYSLTGHTHEREISRHLGYPVYFMPHVAPHFRGLSVTVSAQLEHAVRREAVQALYEEAYADEPMVEVWQAVPTVQHAAELHVASVGGFAVDEARARVVVVATLDNLLKGAATQAIQNLNLAAGFSERLGLPI